MIEKWRRKAACKNTDPNLFFPSRGDYEMETAAKSMCAVCPVKSQCLEYALNAGDCPGIWGGTSAKERRGIKKHRNSQRIHLL